MNTGTTLGQPQHLMNPRHPTPKASKQSLSPLNFSPGSRSPANAGSIPSSPTSIHSSSSAIFERDIEVPPKSALGNGGLSPNNVLPTNKDPHHTARAIAHEPLENAVPSVLTAAVAALGEYEGSSKEGSQKRGMSFEDISVLAPVPLSPNHWPAPASGGASSRMGLSRSPSPHSLPLPLPQVGGGGVSSMTSPPSSSGASTPGSSPSRIISRQSTQQQSISTAMESAPSPVIPGAFPQQVPTINTSLTPATDPGHAPHLMESNVASRGSTPGVIGIVPPTPNANTFSFGSFNNGINPFDAVTGGSPPSATASPLVVTPPLPVGTRQAASRSTSRPTSVATSLYDELSLAPLLVTSQVDELVPVPTDVEPLAFSGNAHLHHHRPPSPSAFPMARDPSSLTSNAASKRLSFISYNDLLNSTPISSFPLSNLTSPNSNSTEPPHQIEVSSKPRTGSRQSTINNVNRSPTSDVFGPMGGGGETGGDVGVTSVHGHSHDSGPKGGGEWERGGFGTGLEERLEAAYRDQQVKDSASSTTS